MRRNHGLNFIHVSQDGNHFRTGLWRNCDFLFRVGFVVGMLARRREKEIMETFFGSISKKKSDGIDDQSSLK
jgi:hypothetical protein